MAVKRMLTVIILTQLTFKYVNSGGESFAPLNSELNVMWQDTPVIIVNPTLENVSLDFAARTSTQSTKIIPRVRFIQTTTTAAIIPDDKSLEDCLYDEDSGDLINTSGNCDHSCVDGKFIEIFFIAREMFCCCRLSVVDRILINHLVFDIVEVSSTGTSKEDTTMTVTEMSVSPSITTEILITSPEDRPMQNCLYDNGSGDLVSTTGNCDQSCNDGKVIKMVSFSGKKFCCCKLSATSVADITLINFSTMKSSFDTTILSSTESTKEDTTMTVTEMSITPSITTIVSIMSPKDQPMRDCTYKYGFGDLISASGNCDHSCVDGKITEIVFFGGEMFCCCKRSVTSVADITLINFSTMKSSFDTTILSLTESTKEDTTTTVTKMSVTPSITTIASIMSPKDQPMRDCTYKYGFGDLVGASGNCDHSCVDGKITEIVFFGGEMFCCCKRSVTSVADITLINFSTMKSSFDTTILSSTESTKEDTTTTVTEMSVTPSITTIASIMSPQDQPIQDCTYNAQSGELTSSSGSCLDSCQSNKILHSFYINNLLLCCCKLIQNKIEVILPQDMPLEECVFDPISNEVTNIGGDCYESCADGKFIAMFQVSKKRTLCCCK